ncbi:MAG TPA: D-alanyl-D-alanine carboxypeptidase/D-alanyl-D-alanine-endopeptidase [Gaiellaceae bacterium]|nr:D-alanyl-D-alanine carboxypeptidase/D-alanyl-D-alanine-endopeptidase [Gaiellaceae bacterium]
MRLLAAALSILALSAGAAVADTGSLHAKLAGTFAVPGVSSTSSTAMVVSLPSGRVVFARNADLSLEPASNEKLSVTYAALVELGPSYRFPTEVLGEGRRVGSTWEGRLILKGFGNPALTSSDLQRLVGILWREGIRRVTGGVAGDESAFDSDRVAPGWLPSFAGIESPPLSALVVDRAARNGRIVAAPALAAAARLDQLMRRRGIVARGAFRGRAAAHAVPLAVIYSEPLSQILQFMDHWSDNFTAEMILKAIGYKALGQGTTEAGAAVTRRDLVSAGIPVAGVRIADGSGLSRDDRVTARELTSLLVKMWNDPEMRPVVWNSLPVAGQPGTLQNRLLDNPKHRLVRAKTGTTDIASALSGYVGRRFAFVAIENGNPVDYWAAHSAEDGVADALLDEMR